MQVLPFPTRVLRAVLLGSFYLVLTALKVCCLVLRRWRGLDTTYLTPLTGSRGVSVIIPHHDDLEMLQECLASVIEAAGQVSEPVEVLLVANGANAARYAGLEKQFPSVRWFFFPALLEFAGAIRCGLENARFDWVYLLNDDMVVDRLALDEVLKCRRTSTFAVASQILVYHSGQPREETGYTFYRVVNGIIELDHHIPSEPARGEKILYAGGGSSLFHRCRLIEFMGRTDPYRPCYFEDAEWSVLAWKHGYEVIVCPESQVRHRHRVTHQQLFGTREINRMFERNACRFQLRNALHGGSDRELCLRLLGLDEKSFREVCEWRQLIEVLRVRARGYTFPFPLLGPEGGLPPFEHWVLISRLLGAWFGRTKVITATLLRSVVRWGKLLADTFQSAWNSLTVILWACRRKFLLFLVRSLVAVPRGADRLACALQRVGLLIPERSNYRGYNQGVSVVIPERGNPALLGDCLGSVRNAAAKVSEPLEVIVVVNGSPRRNYDELVKQHPQVKWLFFERPLWFCGAVMRGLKLARYDWVYLLNDDMVLDPLALHEVLKWRAQHVFAVASQIYFKDSHRRREETGWTQFRWSQEGAFEIFDAEPASPQVVRGSFYAGGGSSLFRRYLLQRFVGSGDAFHPFYWEDVEWGTLAWKQGFEVLFCPASKVWHSHRATYNQLFTEAEIQRIFNRNGYRFQLRNDLRGPSVTAQTLVSQLLTLEWPSLAELVRPSVLMGIVRSRLRSHLYPFNEMTLEHVWTKYYFQPFDAGSNKPLVVLVSPFALYPPAHGGAVRLHHLISVLSDRFRFVILSDEGDAYNCESWKYCQTLDSLHLVTGRKEPAEPVERRIPRILSHSRPELQQQLRLLSVCYHPALVQIEFIELAKLIEVRANSAPWVVTLHDVFLDENSAQHSEEDQYELDLIRRFDTTVACSYPDAALLNLPRVTVIPNGVDVNGLRNYYPSQGNALLFTGPFRYTPNLRGIELFLERVYPQLLEKVVDLELWILAGRGGAEIAADRSCFRQPGVTVLDFTEHPGRYLKRCAVTLNPVWGIRGSSLKLLESVAAGRVCVSTVEGARGFLEERWSSLVTVERVEDMARPLEHLLLDTAYRHSLERLPEVALEAHTWQHSGKLLGTLYEQLMQGHRPSEIV